MLYKTLFQTFNNNNTIKGKRETRTNTKKKKKIGNNISIFVIVIVTYSLLSYSQMENYKEQCKKEKRIEIECLRTGMHDGHA